MIKHSASALMMLGWKNKVRRRETNGGGRKENKSNAITLTRDIDIPIAMQTPTANGSTLRAGVYTFTPKHPLFPTLCAEPICSGC
ncbi:hypothetical protein PISMIDRAFT_681091 [Pisolithus microcarpus 441]|uniref:Uncharacterized protein n=1 Tax=Pisolithus microcarpus 441 TaxID=765257 RepID=A0A0C9ZPD8_9AGAM|nr:hypothetical protein PISMIDRAFT_681091 [Pisolithus microcarpus 441]